MHRLDPIALAIPVFLAAILVEAAVARRRGLRVYRFFDAITDLSCGVGNQTVGLLLALVTVTGYGYVFRHYPLVRWDAGSPWPWVVGIVGLDFLYYWWHRASHEVNFLWAAHVVHHQSEDYNLAVALRQAWFTGLTSLPFYLPLAMLGANVEVFVISNSISLVYQFWIHTELVRTVDPFEWILNTPSHHRVHHATNPQYLDRNYGAILIIWDRMFGTFEPEREPCVYGITKPLASTNPVWANFHYWVELLELSASAPTWRGKLMTPFRRPGYDERTRRVELPPFTPRESFQKFVPPRPSPGLTAYVYANFLVVATGVMLLLLFHNTMALPAVGVCVAAIVAATVGWSALFEQRRWAVPFEAARVAATLAVVAWLWRTTPWT
jgi:sterol desaturase/sphingolipid hydroxylase (fatty acid hydroxylase superfamily)